MQPNKSTQPNKSVQSSKSIQAASVDSKYQQADEKKADENNFSKLDNSVLENNAARMPMLKPALSLFIALALILGLCYPLLMTGVAQVTMADKANGSLVEHNGSLVGSALIGQRFDQPEYLWTRPSAAGDGYDAAQSSGSNLGPLNPELVTAVEAQVQRLKAADPQNTAPIPLDLVTMSGSGLDPHISPAAAEWQVNRVARIRGISVEQVQKAIDEHTEARQFNLFGEPRVNVLAVNLALDEMAVVK
ncbi:potassium-transporting ATPase subunit KdpC [Psychrobacter sp. ANT_H3]|uniref:potassium-transporting ATPase subunit KdpC n=1 Tax=Psychrobacter sp. ANT_H3 TaxID=3019444 RepID=UPI0022F15024|nr:potassium-transporting ATPase subunit KdpC [Psychrobacter sp. ANT_H3]MDA5132352.1 potassium-transporting ATPase subunit KdpC [Psychrobacter sp. ANT_H3]